MSILEVADMLKEESERIAKTEGISFTEAFNQAIETLKERCELV